MKKHTTTTAKQAQYKAEAEAREDALKASLKEGMEQLQAEIAAGKSERLTALMDMMSRFPRYSFHNIALILGQCPDATYVQSYKAWESMGYHVAKGSKAIRIFAPRTGHGEKVGKDGEIEERAFTYFVLVPVFDVSQIDPEEITARPLPRFYYDLGSDEQSDTLLSALTTAMQGDGIRLGEEEMSGEKQGYSVGGYVATRLGLSSKNRAKTLTHEYAHEILHTGKNALLERGKLTRNQVEHQAEATAYVVLHHYGIRNPFSADYLQNWGATEATIPEQMSVIATASRIIIEKVDAALKAREEEGKEDAQQAIA